MHSAALPAVYELDLGVGFAQSMKSRKQAVWKFSVLFRCSSLRNVVGNQPTDLHKDRELGAVVSVAAGQLPLLQFAFGLLSKLKLDTRTGTSVLKAHLSIHPSSWVLRGQWATPSRHADNAAEAKISARTSAMPDLSLPAVTILT